MQAVNRPNAGHDGDPNDVLRDHGIEDLKARLDEAFDPGAEAAFDPGNTEYDEAGKRFDEVPPNEGEAPNGQDTGDASPNEGGAYHIIGDLEASKKLESRKELLQPRRFIRQLVFRARLPGTC